MNNHTIPYESLIDFAAGDLSEIDSAATAEHVAQCPECSVTVQRFRRLSELRFVDLFADPPPATIARAEALFARYNPQPQRKPWFNWNWASGPVFAAAAVLVVCMLSIAALAIRNASPDTPLYQVKLAVQGLELRVSDVLHQFSETPRPKPTPTPTPTPHGADTNLLGPDSPVSVPPGQGQAPLGQTNTPPGQGKIPPGQINVPPGQGNVPPGQGNSPPGQSNSPPGQGNSPPGQGNSPPGQSNPPAGQGNSPPGQSNPPAGQAKTPAGQAKTPAGQGNQPSGQSLQAPIGSTPTPTFTPTPTVTPTPFGTPPPTGTHKDQSGNSQGNTSGKK